MMHLLYKYLIINKQVTLPGIGVLSINRKPARHDLVDKVFQSPVFNIELTSETSIADNKLFVFISREKGIDEAEAFEHLHDFAYRLKEDVSLNKIVELPGIGVLGKDNLGHLSLRSTDVIRTFFPPVISEDTFVARDNQAFFNNRNSNYSKTEQALSNETKTALKAKDFWWVYAIVLALIGIGGIFYYYYHHKSFR